MRPFGFVFLINRTHFTRLQPIPISLIAKANEDAEFDTLRVWIALKQLYKRHTIIYNLRYDTLSNQTGISHTTLRKHIRIMFDNKWVKWTKNGHLILTSINKLKKHKNETCILVPVQKNKSDQILHLRKVILHRNIKNQEKQIKQKKEIIHKCGRASGLLSKSEMSKMKKAGGLTKLENSLQTVTTLSNKSIGQLFTKSNGLTLSRVTGCRIQSKLRKEHLIKTKTRVELFKTNSSIFEYNSMNREYKGYIFNPTSKNLYKRLSNEIGIAKH